MERRTFLTLMGEVMLGGPLLFSGCATRDSQVPEAMLNYRPLVHGPFNILVMPGDDPARCMSVVYHNLDSASQPVVYYDTVPREGKLEAYAQRAYGETRTIPGLFDGRRVQGVKLDGLEPGTVYYFMAGDPETGLTREFSFRTFPATGPFRLAIGGDMGATPLAAQLLGHVGAQDVDAFIVGGDIAYAHGELPHAPRWDAYLQIVHEKLRAPDGRIIPFWAAIGNHEINRELEAPTDDPNILAPFYTGFLWPQGEGSFGAHRLGGDEALLLFLDSGHLHSHESQVPWLEEQLRDAKNIPNVFSIHHVPLFPTHREFDNGGSTAGRDHWMPLFDQYRVSVAFEHHDHVFKRTYPLVNGVPTEGGTIYLGDGCMGVFARTTTKHDYHVKVDGRPHFRVVEIGGGETRIRAIDDEGKPFDYVAVAPRKTGVSMAFA